MSIDDTSKAMKVAIESIVELNKSDMAPIIAIRLEEFGALRDLFAAAALCGSMQREVKIDDTLETVTETYYAIADAMMEARKK